MAPTRVGITCRNIIALHSLRSIEFREITGFFVKSSVKLIPDSVCRKFNLFPWQSTYIFLQILNIMLNRLKNIFRWGFWTFHSLLFSRWKISNQEHSESITKYRDYISFACERLLSLFFHPLCVAMYFTNKSTFVESTVSDVVRDGKIITQFLNQ